jgi:RNA polymerase sigma-70 factor (ECF subfamily)
MNDFETARRIAAGDPEEAERFVRLHYPSIFRMMRHLAGQREDAEDLTQQAFVLARARMGTFRGSASLKTWLHRVAFNEYAQWKRKRKRTVPLKADLASDDPGYGSCIAGESLLTALAALPNKLRESFLLHEVEEMPVAEIAQVLRVPTGTIKARLFYARRRLRALLEVGPEATHHEPQEALL